MLRATGRETAARTVEPPPGSLRQLTLSHRRPRWRTGLQPQVHKDPLDHRRFESDRDDLELAAAVRAVFEFDLEEPNE